MPQIVHMQSDRKYDGPGTPIHRLWTKWHGDPQFKTTTNQTEVTCKVCRRMLERQRVSLERTC
jgi:hypothetical protein